jgi:hypothetical protein
MAKTPTEIRIRDRLKADAGERRKLLAISTGPLLSCTGRIPTTMSGLEWKSHRLSTRNSEKVSRGLLSYFLPAFVIHAVSDWLSGRWRLELALKADVNELSVRIREALIHRGEGQAGLADVMHKVRRDLESHRDHPPAASEPRLHRRYEWSIYSKLAVPLRLGLRSLASDSRLWRSTPGPAAADRSILVSKTT